MITGGSSVNFNIKR
jgi:hypothetical protein